jgi:hypothetical protein
MLSVGSDKPRQMEGKRVCTKPLTRQKRQCARN